MIHGKTIIDCNKICCASVCFMRKNFVKVVIYFDAGCLELGCEDLDEANFILQTIREKCLASVVSCTNDKKKEWWKLYQQSQKTDSSDSLE